MTALLSVPIYQKISLTSKVMEKKYCFIVCCHAILISSQLSLHGLVIKYHELHGFRFNKIADKLYSAALDYDELVTFFIMITNPEVRISLLYGNLMRNTGTIVLSKKRKR